MVKPGPDNEKLERDVQQHAHQNQSSHYNRRSGTVVVDILKVVSYTKQSPNIDKTTTSIDIIGNKPVF